MVQVLLPLIRAADNLADLRLASIALRNDGFELIATFLADNASVCFTYIFVSYIYLFSRESDCKFRV